MASYTPGPSGGKNILSRYVNLFSEAVQVLTHPTQSAATQQTLISTLPSLYQPENVLAKIRYNLSLEKLRKARISGDAKTFFSEDALATLANIDKRLYRGQSQIWKDIVTNKELEEVLSETFLKAYNSLGVTFEPVDRKEVEVVRTDNSTLVVRDLDVPLFGLKYSETGRQSVREQVRKSPKHQANRLSGAYFSASPDNLLFLERVVVSREPFRYDENYEHPWHSLRVGLSAENVQAAYGLGVKHKVGKIINYAYAIFPA